MHQLAFPLSAAGRQICDARLLEILICLHFWEGFRVHFGLFGGMAGNRRISGAHCLDALEFSNSKIALLLIHVGLRVGDKLRRNHSDFTEMSASFLPISLKFDRCIFSPDCALYSV